MGKISQQLGKAGEQAAEWFLKSIGAKCIEKISTPMTNVNGKAIYTKKSSIDYTAVIPYYNEQNKVARIEVKLCDKDRLHHSVLSAHQVDWLTEWAELKFPAYVLWIHKSKCYLIDYPNYWFRKGKSLCVEIAKQITVYKN